MTPFIIITIIIYNLIVTTIGKRGFEPDQCHKGKQTTPLNYKSLDYMCVKSLNFILIWS